MTMIVHGLCAFLVDACYKALYFGFLGFRALVHHCWNSPVSPSYKIYRLVEFAAHDSVHAQRLEQEDLKCL
ncbi:hypothetical protein BD408DRAFT_417890 [Parasitella parasitica]|nr:hypothetical protein BD408DRAFT_417890 [Parasitella parasitica]